jgi:hypothetical protein
LAFRGARGIRCRARTVSGVRGSPAASGCEGGHGRAADRQNLIRVMPAEGGAP